MDDILYIPNITEDKTLDFLQDNTFYYFLFVIVILAFLGSSFTNIQDEFYVTLEKPVWSPNPKVISFFWTILFVLITFSTYYAYINSNEEEKNTLLIIFSVQVILNFLWTYTFFYLKNPRASRIIVILLILAILLQISFMYDVYPLSSYLFIPYLLWCCFAAYLNFEIVKLNQM